MKHILIVDDDIDIGNLIEEMLKQKGYTVSRAYSGTEALLVLSQKKPDLILLDLMLPGLSGEEVLPKIKDIPVIVISAKVDVQDKISLLLGGAVDYVTKPFHLEELAARVEVHLRNSSAQDSSKALIYDDLVLDLNKHTVSVNDQEVVLTRTEYAVLKKLMQEPKRVITKGQLLDYIFEDTPDCTESSLKVHVSHLRSKLREVADKEYIESIWGIGYKMKER